MLPERRQGEAKESVRRYFLKTEIPRLRDKDDVPGVIASDRISYVFSHLGSLLASTMCAWRRPDENERWIEWNASDAEALLRKFIAWWQDEKQALERMRPREDWLSQRMTSLVSNLISVLGEVIIPRLHSSSRDALREFLAAVKQAGYSVLLAQPALLALDPADSENAAERIRYSLHGSTGEAVREAAGAIFSWLAFATRENFPAPPSDLLNDLVGHIATRRQPGLTEAIGQISPIILNLPSALQPHHLDDLVRGLGYLLLETTLQPRGQEHDELRLSAEERLALRADASELAAQLTELCRTRSIPISPTLEEWRRQGSATNTLPEVRMPWQRHSE